MVPPSCVLCLFSMTFQLNQWTKEKKIALHVSFFLTTLLKIGGSKYFVLLPTPHNTYAFSIIIIL